MNINGQLGDGTTENRNTPTCIFRDGKWLAGGEAGESSFTAEDVLFRASVAGKDVPTEVEWDDAWFDADPSTYNHELATTASVLAMAAYMDEDPVKGDFEKLGFEDVCYYNPENGPNGRYAAEDGGYNQVGYSFATRRAGDGTPIVAVLVRGTPSNEEWLGNVNINDDCKTDTPYHQGFMVAAVQVETALASYLGSRGIDASSARFLVTGHSRGAAVANLVGAYLDEGKLAGVSASRVYSFTFASPTVAKGDVMASGRYGNIFNIVNPEDIVPQVPLTRWGFGRYGKTLVLPSRSNTFWPTYCHLVGNMDQVFSTYIGGMWYRSFEFGALPSKLAIKAVGAGAGSVDDFYNKKRMSTDNVGDGFFQAKMTMRDLFEALIRKHVLKDDSQDGTLEYASTVPVFVGVFAAGAIPILIDGMGAVGDELLHMHTQETYVSWMQSADAPAGSYPPIFRDSYKGFRIACPVDVHVYDAEGALVCSIEGDVVDESLMEAGGLPAMVVDGVKYVDVPSDAGYRVETTAREDGEMDFLVEELAGDGSAASDARAYLGVPLEGGQEFVMECSGEDNPSGMVLETGGSEAGAESIVSGDAVEYVAVSVGAEGPGDAWGGGQAVAGASVTVHAQPADGGGFLGWYSGGELASRDADYTFKAAGDAALTARFGQLPDAADGEAASGAAALLDALPDPSAVSAGDADAVRAALGAYDALTDAQRALLPAGAAERAEALRAALASLPAAAGPGPDAPAGGAGDAAGGSTSPGDAAPAAPVAKVSIAGAKVANVWNATYNGKAQAQKPTVTLGGKVLVAGRDYKLTYRNNVKVGTATMTVTGIGGYTGTKSATFKVTVAANSLAKAKVTGAKKRTYNGTAQTQSPKVKLGKKALKAGRDYTITYSRNVNAGTATATVRGIGAYSGTKTFTFKIAPAKLSKAKAGVSAQKYTGKPVTPSPVVRVGGKVLRKDVDYTVTYKNNVKKGTAKLVIAGKGNYTGKKTVKFKIS